LSARVSDQWPVIVLNIGAMAGELSKAASWAEVIMPKILLFVYVKCGSVIRLLGVLERRAPKVTSGQKPLRVVVCG
jgi:hypothetical protein